MLCAIVVLNLLLFCPAYGKTFGPFSVEVPAGWEAEYNAEAGNASLILSNAGKSAEVSLVVTSLEGETFTEYMEFLAQEGLPGASKPEKQGNGTWVIKYDHQAYGLAGTEIYTPIERYGLYCLTILGQDPALEQVVGSIKFDFKADF